MQAHTLGEVGILDIVLLRVYSRTVILIFIEIGSYLTIESKRQFGTAFLRHSVFLTQVSLSVGDNVARQQPFLSCRQQRQSIKDAKHFRCTKKIQMFTRLSVRSPSQALPLETTCLTVFGAHKHVTSLNSV